MKKTFSPTPAQLDTMQAIVAGTVRMANTGYSSFRIQGASPQVVGRLVSLRWARWPKGPVGEQVCELTAAGAAALPADRLPPRHVAALHALREDHYRDIRNATAPADAAAFADLRTWHLAVCDDDAIMHRLTSAGTAKVKEMLGAA